MRIRPFAGDEIATCELRFIPADGNDFDVTLVLGRPYRLDSGDWACPCELRGFESRYPDICGVDSLQALTLALALLKSRLDEFVTRGGKIVDAIAGTEWNPQMLIAAIGPAVHGPGENRNQ